MNAPIKVRTANLNIPSNPNYSDSVTKANNTHIEKKDRERETGVGVLGREGLVHLNKLVRDDCIGSYLLSKYFHLLLCHHHPILIHMHLLSTLSYLFCFATLC